MTKTLLHTDRKPFWRGCVVVAVGATILVGVLLLRERARSVAWEQTQAQERQKWVEWVKEGRTFVNVHDLKLIPILANDAECISHVEELYFDYVEITPEDARHVSKFVNLRSLGFYSCDGADLIMEHSRSLPIEELWFESTYLSHDTMRNLAKPSKLKKVHFGYVMQADAIAILKTIPATIAVETLDPESRSVRVLNTEDR